MCRPPTQKGRQNHALGRFRGGFSCKTHLKTDFDGLPIGFHLIVGEVSDSTQLEVSLDIGPDIKPRAAMTDKGYLVRAGHDPDDLAREFEPTAQSIRNWISQADNKEGPREDVPPCLSGVERDELSRLRRENKQLRVERGILSKAATWFAREAGGSVVRLFRFMSANQACFPVATMARVLGVSKAGFHAWRHRLPSRHAAADAALLKRVRTVHAKGIVPHRVL